MIYDIKFDMNTINKMRDRIDLYGDNFITALGVVCNTVAKKMEGYARANARWTNITGNARQGLKGEAKASREHLAIIVAHRMEYGFWLELAHARKYKILEESIEANIGELVSAIEELINKS